ncbi:MAG: hypothetical protein AAB625_01045 [Patescibacteria group bacterium]
MLQNNILNFTYIFLIFAGTLSVGGLLMVYFDKKKRIKSRKKR